jgi:hypothetical protein
LRRRDYALAARQCDNALAGLLSRVVADIPSEKIDRYLIRDAQRLIESIETLVRIHAAQENDIYDALASQ